MLMSSDLLGYSGAAELFHGALQDPLLSIIFKSMQAETFRICYQDTFLSVDSELGKAQQSVSPSLLKAAEPE